jgi:2-polyprenyl-3-methyl-5-hydroxy-6-metoxy-1,4-benzoquinol methylase
MIYYEACPGCGQKNIYKVLVAKDYTVSHEQFEIWECGNCSLRFTQNVPEQEVIGFYYQSSEYISHSDTTEGIINKLYHFVRRRTLISKRHLVKKVTGISKGVILDVGSGTGAFLQMMVNAGWEGVGLEPDATARQKAKDLYDLSLRDASSFFDLPDSTFDVITLWHVLEHVHDLQGDIKQLRRLLKPGGKCLIAVPNYKCFDQELYKEYWAAYDVPRHLYHFSPEAMKQLLKLHGLVLEQVRPMWFDSFYICLLSEKYRSGKSHVVSGFFNGFLSNFKTINHPENSSSIIYVVSLV